MHIGGIGIPLLPQTICPLMLAAIPETLQIWNALPKTGRSRSLAAERFVDFPSDPQDKECRKRASEAIRDGQTDSRKAKVWQTFVKSTGAMELHATLQARLMVNMASGVFENGNLALDRFSGIPYIPGSAVKGCARRFAIHALAEAPPNEKQALLEDIAAVFGWGDQDWKSGRKKNKDSSEGEFYSDFEPSCGTEWEALKALFKNKPAQSSGQVAFLPAFPVDGDPGIDLDIVTGHHTNYYKGGPPVATDTEEPVPVIFPAVSAFKKPNFLFGLLPLHSQNHPLAEKARTWLKQGLETFGIGAKTAAGYGWFKCLEQAEVEAHEAQAAVAASAFPTELVFQNAIIARLNKPQEYENLKKEIEKLQRPENTQWLEKLKTHLASSLGKDARKRLKDKEWFPKDWLPQL